MNLGDNLTNSFNYAKQLFDDVGRLIILMILAVIPIVNFIVAGYLGNVLKQPKGEKQLPPLEKYTDLWIQGLKIILAAIIFMIVPLVLAGAALITLILSVTGLAGIIGPTGIGAAIAVPLAYLGLAIAFFIGLILAMTIVHMLKKDDFGKVFAINDALAIIGKIGWIDYIVWMIVLFIISGVVTVVFFNIPVVGWILEFIHQ